MRRRPLTALMLCAFVTGSSRAEAWPAELSKRIAKDALKMLPRSLAEVLTENELAIFGEARATKMAALPLVRLDLSKGRISKATMAALDKEFSERVRALQVSDFRTAVIALGATYRLAVDLADPGVGIGLGDDVTAQALRREFYLFVAANRDKIPPVVVHPESLQMTLDALPRFLADTALKTSEQAANLRADGRQDGRVVPFTEIDFTSPVFAVASFAYSRSVSAVAATWTCIWRSAGGDMTRRRPLQTINPRHPPQEPGQLKP